MCGGLKFKLEWCAANQVLVLSLLSLGEGQSGMLERASSKGNTFQNSDVEEARLQSIKKGGSVEYQANLEPIKKQNLFYWQLSTLENLRLKQHEKTRKKTVDKEGFILALKALDQNQKDTRCRIPHTPASATSSGKEGCTGRVGRN